MAELGLSDFENISITQGSHVVTQYLRLLSLPRAGDVLLGTRKESSALAFMIYVCAFMCDLCVMPR